MPETGLHPGLELRLRTLAGRIAKLRQKLKYEEGTAKLKDLGELAQLERREKRLRKQLSELDAKGAGFWQNATAEFDKKMDDIEDTIHNFLMRLDQEYAAHSKSPKN